MLQGIQHYVRRACMFVVGLREDQLELLPQTFIVLTKLFRAYTEDLNKGVLVSPSTTLPKQGREGLRQLLHDRNVKIVSFSDWEKIDFKEKRRGSTINKPKEKLVAWEEQLKTASG